MMYVPTVLNILVTFLLSGAFGAAERSLDSPPVALLGINAKGRIIPPVHAVRGGSSYHRHSSQSSSIYEINPNYVPSPHHADYNSYNSSNNQRPITLGDLEESETYIQQQPHIFYERHSYERLGLFEFILSRVSALYRANPDLAIVSSTCVFVFLAWQIPSYIPTLQRHFICSHHNIKQRRWSVMILSALSHVGFLHLFFNLYALLTFGPTVQKVLQSSQSYHRISVLRHPIFTTLWPLMAGAAFTGSVSHLIFDRKSGGCMGLSSVTLALLAVFASTFPNNILGFFIAGIIPVRMPAKFMLQLTLMWSAICTAVITFGGRSHTISHAGHLGGLLFGMLYHEIFINNCRNYHRFLKSTRTILFSS